MALHSNIAGGNNVAVGNRTLQTNGGGSWNVAIGVRALEFNVTGTSNIAIGADSGPQSGSTGLGNTIAIGDLAKVTQSNMIRLGSDSITLFSCKVGLNASSDRNLKENFLRLALGLPALR